MIDDVWSDYLARLENFRAGIPWQSDAAVPSFFVGLDYRDPHFTFLRQINEWFPELVAASPAQWLFWCTFGVVLVRRGLATPRRS